MGKRGWAPSTLRNCAQCGGPIEPNLYDDRYSYERRTYCSRTCGNQARRLTPKERRRRLKERRRQRQATAREYAEQGWQECAGCGLMTPRPPRCALCRLEAIRGPITIGRSLRPMGARTWVDEVMGWELWQEASGDLQAAG